MASVHIRTRLRLLVLSVGPFTLMAGAGPVAAQETAADAANA
jgi:hypothetical protein